MCCIACPDFSGCGWYKKHDSFYKKRLQKRWQEGKIKDCASFDLLGKMKILFCVALGWVICLS